MAYRQIADKISFNFEGKKYEVDMDAYRKNLRIQLPDGRLLRVERWLECGPPIPHGLKIIEVAKAVEVE